MEEINLLYEGVYWGGGFFQVRGMNKFSAAEGGLPQIGKPWASTTALHTPAPLSFTFTEKKGDIPS